MAISPASSPAAPTEVAGVKVVAMFILSPVFLNSVAYTFLQLIVAEPKSFVFVVSETM